MISKNKSRLVLSIDKEKIKEFKKKAIDANMTLSELVTEKLSEVIEEKTIREVAENK